MGICGEGDRRKKNFENKNISKNYQTSTKTETSTQYKQQILPHSSVLGNGSPSLNKEAPIIST